MDCYLPGTGDKWRQNETFSLCLDHCWLFLLRVVGELTDANESILKMTNKIRSAFWKHRISKPQIRNNLELNKGCDLICGHFLLWSPQFNDTNIAWAIHLNPVNWKKQLQMLFVFNLFSWFTERVVSRCSHAYEKMAVQLSQLPLRLWAA